MNFLHPDLSLPHFHHRHTFERTSAILQAQLSSRTHSYFQPPNSEREVLRVSYGESEGLVPDSRASIVRFG